MAVHPQSSPLILANAPNGATRGKADHPCLPVSIGEIAETAASVAEAGASFIHVHVRDSAGRHLLDAGAYQDVTAAIRAEVGNRLVIQVTSEAGGRYQPAEQMAVIRETKPEAVSLALRELIATERDEPEAARFLGWLRANHVMVQVILYTAEEVIHYAALQRRGVLGEGPEFPLYVLGRYPDGQVSQPADLLAFIAASKQAGMTCPWAMCAFGRAENACARAAAQLGGHVRVGFENNLWLPDGSFAADNACLVRLAADGARSLGRPLATAADVRALVGT